MLLQYSEEEAVRIFLKNGYQISKSALHLVLSSPEDIISGLRKLKPRPFLITEKHIKKILGEKKEIEPKETSKVSFPSKKSIKIEDYVKQLRSRYEKFRAILSKRMDKEKLISINKISQQRIFSIIGIVRERGDSNLLLEDISGEIHVYFDGVIKKTLEKTSLDDIIGVRCKKIKDKIFAINIIYPEIR